MQPFTVLTAVAAPLEIAKIDTGMILPGRYMRRHRRPGHDYGEAFLYDLRFDDKGQPRADFPTNQPAYRDAKILVTDQDFGCGSSREGAAFAVMDFGLQALVGVSFGEIFQGNCIQNGIVAVTLPEAAIHDLWRQLREKPGAEITIDLPNQTVIAPDGNRTVSTSARCARIAWCAASTTSTSRSNTGTPSKPSRPGGAPRSPGCRRRSATKKRVPFEWARRLPILWRHPRA